MKFRINVTIKVEKRRLSTEDKEQTEVARKEEQKHVFCDTDGYHQRVNNFITEPPAYSLAMGNTQSEKGCTGVLSPKMSSSAPLTAPPQHTW